MRKLAILLCCLLAACGDKPDEAVGPAVEQGTPVTVARPELREVNYVLKALGTSESIQHPTIAAETSGRVVELNVTEGAPVRAGAVLVKIDDTLHRIDAAKAQAELKRAQVLLDNQAREVERLTRLAEKGAVSKDHLEDEQDQQKVLAAQRDIARKQWEQASYLESRTRVAAPLDSLVTRRHVSVGDYVNVGQPLVDLVAIDTLRARLAFPEQDAALVALGKGVWLRSPAAPGIEALGQVTNVNPQIETGSRALEIIVEFANPGGWLPGGSVDATLLVETRTGALTVPRISVVRRNERDVVYVLENDMARERVVSLGWREADWIEIVSGIGKDDWVVVEGAALVTDGSAVSAMVPES